MALGRKTSGYAAGTSGMQVESKANIPVVLECRTKEGEWSRVTLSGKWKDGDFHSLKQE